MAASDATCAYIALRPRHILCAIVIALERPGAQHRLFIAERLAKSDLDRYLDAIASWRGSPFSEVILLRRRRRGHGFGARITSPLRKLAVTLSNRATIRRELTAHPPSEMYVCNDHAVETQFALHCATQLRPGVRRIYVEDGSGAYGYQRAPTRPPPFPRLRGWFKATMRRAFYGGMRWEYRAILGATHWIDEAALAFPDQIAPELRGLRVRKLPSTTFSRPEFVDFLALCAARFGVDRQQIVGIQVLIAIAHSSSSKHVQGYATSMTTLCRDLAGAGIRVGIKFHPHEPDPEYISIEACQNLQVLPAAAPFELFLVMIGNPTLNVIGDVSTALVSTRWILPDARAFALDCGPEAGTYKTTLRNLGVSVQADLSAVAREVTAELLANSRAS